MRTRERFGVIETEYGMINTKTTISSSAVRAARTGALVARDLKRRKLIREDYVNMSPLSQGIFALQLTHHQNVLLRLPLLSGKAKDVKVPMVLGENPGSRNFTCLVCCTAVLRQLTLPFIHFRDPNVSASRLSRTILSSCEHDKDL
jgi:hypothetical protein